MTYDIFLLHSCDPYGLPYMGFRTFTDGQMHIQNFRMLQAKTLTLLHGFSLSESPPSRLRLGGSLDNATVTIVTKQRLVTRTRSLHTSLGVASKYTLITRVQAWFCSKLPTLGSEPHYSFGLFLVFYHIKSF